MYSVHRAMLYICCLFLLACADKNSPVGSSASQDAIPLLLEDIVTSDSGAYFAVVQTAAGPSFLLPLELCPASAVDLLLEGVRFPRPLTHDLLLAAADSLGVVVKGIVLSLGPEAVPEANIMLGGGGNSALRATLGDAIALHYASAAPLMAAPELVAYFTTVEPASKIVLAPPSLSLSSRRARLAQVDTALVEMSLLGVVQSAADLAVVLLDPTLRRAFPVFIGFCQASSIVATLQNEDGPPVRSHQLLVDLLRVKRVSIEYARIVALRGDTYIGELVLRVGSSSFVLDARPSDAIALALRTGAPVQLVKFLLDEVSEDAEPYRALFANVVGKFVPR